MRPIKRVENKVFFFKVAAIREIKAKSKKNKQKLFFIRVCVCFVKFKVIQDSTQAIYQNPKSQPVRSSAGSGPSSSGYLSKLLRSVLSFKVGI